MTHLGECLKLFAVTSVLMLIVLIAFVTKKEQMEMKLKPDEIRQLENVVS
jgi:hypothetical protein